MATQYACWGTMMAVLAMAGSGLTRPSTLLAQQPARDSSRATLVGLVRDSTGAPIPDVQVVLFTLGLGAYTDAQGWFTLANVPPGDYDIRFQHLGYRQVDAKWQARAGARTEVAIVLHTMALALDTVRVSGQRTHRAAGHAAGRAVVLGVVLDSAGAPLPGVRLDLLGTGDHSATGADGRFLFPELAAGSYLMRARRLGFAPRTVPVDVVADSRHTLAIRMNALGFLLDTVEVRAKSGFGRSQSAWRDFDERQQFRSSHTSVTLLREDLRPLGKLPLDLALQYTAAMSLQDVARTLITTSIRPDAVSDPTTITDAASACILVNGTKPLSLPLRAFHASDLQAAEVYAASSLGPESDLTGTIRARMSSIPGCRGSGLGHPAYYVLWFKDAP